MAGLEHRRKLGGKNPLRLQKKRPPVKGPRLFNPSRGGGLIPVVVAAFDDHRPVAAVPVPAAMPAAGRGHGTQRVHTAKLFTSTELASISGNGRRRRERQRRRSLSVSYGRCRNGNSRERCKAQDLACLMFTILW